MKQVKFNDQANKACRENNKTVISANEDEPTKGGNLEAYKEILKAENKQCDAVEYTFYKWEQSVTHLVAYQILSHFKEMKEKEQKEEDNVHPLMDMRTTQVGISFKGHKKVDNVIQLLYVKEAANALEWM